MEVRVRSFCLKVPVQLRKILFWFDVKIKNRLMRMLLLKCGRMNGIIPHHFRPRPHNLTRELRPVIFLGLLSWLDAAELEHQQRTRSSEIALCPEPTLAEEVQALRSLVWTRRFCSSLNSGLLKTFFSLLRCTYLQPFVNPCSLASPCSLCHARPS